jgi:hypothetical protein
MSLPRRATLLGIGLFFLIQLTLGVRGLLLPREVTRGDFSWNMYSDLYRCAVHYTVHAPTGHVLPIDFEAHFADPIHSSKLLHRDRLPRYHRWLCEKHVPAGSELHGLVSCKTNDGPWNDLVPPGTDLCATSDER